MSTARPAPTEHGQRGCRMGVVVLASVATLAAVCTLSLAMHAQVGWGHVAAPAVAYSTAPCAARDCSDAGTTVGASQGAVPRPVATSSEAVQPSTAPPPLSTTTASSRNDREHSKGTATLPSVVDSEGAGKASMSIISTPSSSVPPPQTGVPHARTPESGSGANTVSGEGSEEGGTGLSDGPDERAGGPDAATVDLVSSLERQQRGRPSTWWLKKQHEYMPWCGHGVCVPTLAVVCLSLTVAARARVRTQVIQVGRLQALGDRRRVRQAASPAGVPSAR